MSDEVPVRVPSELQTAFEDALNRPCFACGHPVRDHVSTSNCPCCKKGTQLPSAVADRVRQTAQDALEVLRQRLRSP